MNSTNLTTRCHHKLNNYDSWQSVLFMLVFGIESIVIFVLNACALCVFHQRTFLVKRSTYLLINLTIADFLVGIPAFLSILVKIIDSHVLRSFHTLAIPIPLYGSLFFMTAIALERVYAAFKPLKHRFLSKKDYFVFIAFIWSLVGVFSCFIFFVFQTNVLGGKSDLKKARLVGKSVSVFSSGIPLSIISISYLTLWIKIRFFNNLNFQNIRTIRENNKLAKTLFIITVISLLTWLPKMTSVSFTKRISCAAKMIISSVSTAILFLNSIINFMVYSIRMPEFKNELLRMFRGKCLCCRRATNNSRRHRPIRRRNQVEDGVCDGRKMTREHAQLRNSTTNREVETTM